MRQAQAALVCALSLSLAAGWPTVALAQGEINLFGEDPPAAASVEAEGEGQSNEEDIATRVEQLSERGAELFHQERYREAIATFEEAYALAQVANLLYNIGLSYERLGEGDKAIEAYERFIVARDADPEVRARALERVRALRQAQVRPDDKIVKPDPGPTPDPGQGKIGDKDKGMGALGVTGIIVGGAGVLMTGAGVVFGVLANNEQDNFDSSRDLYTKQVARTNAENRALAADVFYGLGAASLLAGATLFLVDQLSGAEAAPPGEAQGWHLRPDLGPGRAGATIEWNFGSQW